MNSENTKSEMPLGRQKITPFLWFDSQAEEAMNYYVSVFEGSPEKKSESKIVVIKRYPENSEEPHMKGMGGKVLTGVFELEGQRFMALDGGPLFKFNESISMLVECKDQEEIDYFWGKLSAVPASEQCGWCKDKFGLSWQIVPSNMDQWLASGDSEKSGRAIHAMMGMKKIDMDALQKAFDGQ
jgi:predicted 3-demethylubiquinone-9 3-methyltransferase (glyoxalase superfamily)